MDFPNLKSLTQLPLEILELIVSLINPPHELLALALTARIFKDIIIPSHLQFRKIRCKTNSIAIGKTLQKHPFLCMRLRELELIDQRGLPMREPHPMIPKLIMEEVGQDIQHIWDDFEIGDYVPRKPSVLISPFSALWRWLKGSHVAYVQRPNYAFWDSNEGSVVAMIGAILHMKSLTHVRLFLEDVHSPVVFDLLSCIGSSCNNLSHLAFRWGYATPTGISPLWNFKKLETFSLVLTHNHSELTYVENLIDMLFLRCNDLRDLHLSISSYGPIQRIDLSRLLTQGNWRLMNRFAIGGMVSLQTPVEPLRCYQMFIDCHPSLRCIELGRHDNYLFFGLKPESLQCLESLGLYSLPLAPYASGFLEVLQRVKLLTIRKHLEVGFPELCFFQSLSGLTTLKISIGVDFLPKLWKCLPPTLIRLSITVYSGIKQRATNPILQSFLSNISELNITHLCILPRSSVLVNEFRKPEILRRLAVAPSLKYVLVVVGVQNHDKWVSLRRDSSGKYLGYQIAPRGTVKDVLKWGYWPFDM